VASYDAFQAPTHDVAITQNPNPATLGGFTEKRKKGSG